VIWKHSTLAASYARGRRDTLRRGGKSWPIRWETVLEDRDEEGKNVRDRIESLIDKLPVGLVQMRLHYDKEENLSAEEKIREAGGRGAQVDLTE